MFRVSAAEYSATTKRAVKMAKFSLSSWLSTKDSDTSDVERKRQNRRTFSGFSASSPFKANANGAETGKVSNGEKGTSVNGKSNQASFSTLEPASDKASNTAQPPVSATANMVTLSQKIARETEKLESYMKENGLVMPSFDADAADDFPKLPEGIQKSRLEIIHATKELRDLAVGPRESVRWGVWEVSLCMLLPICGRRLIASCSSSTSSRSKLSTITGLVSAIWLR